MEPQHHAYKPLPSRAVFVARLARKALLALCLIAVAVLIGAMGYHFAEGLPWLDATLNASMILSGMGPVDRLQTPGGKLFAIFYCLFSGVVFITMVAVLFAPVIHRFLHRFHLELGAHDKNG